MSEISQNAQTVFHYHESTKHHYDHYAKSLGYMDWDNQPNAFRFYQGAESLRLPLLKTDLNHSYYDLYRTDLTEPKKLLIENVAALMELSMSISAWKEIPGAKWALRMNPSSGNLHPTEAYLILPWQTGWSGVFHYQPYFHGLEMLSDLSKEEWQPIHAHYGREGFFIVLTSIYWREAWKYGERAFRYCQHDMGHALAALRFSAALLGWQVKVISQATHDEMALCSGLSQRHQLQEEKEDPECMLYICPKTTQPISENVSPDLISIMKTKKIRGKANQLSSAHAHWPIIDHVADATQIHLGLQMEIKKEEKWPAHKMNTKALPVASQVIRKRRSAIAFDPDVSVTKEMLFHMLDKTLPRTGQSPFDLGIPLNRIHLFIFAHRVSGLESGLYAFLRDVNQLDALKKGTNDQFDWKKEDGVLPLYLLKKGNYQQEATQISCRQDIAGQSSFSLGMVAEFESVVQRDPSQYRMLFWEGGIIGQVLYLEAEALGVRATGIGCYFDDAMHQLLGIQSRQWQSLYHFTVGGGLDDHRLTTHPPYDHLPQEDLHEE